MPIHDWSRVDDGLFHWFHQTWIVRLSEWLNDGRLPEGIYAIGELYAEGFYPDVLAVEDRPLRKGKKKRRPPSNGHGVLVAESPPERVLPGKPKPSATWPRRICWPFATCKAHSSP